MLEGVNETAVILIPKKDVAECLQANGMVTIAARSLRCLSWILPISLCNVIYKVISKCLVNRLHPLLQDMIVPTQSAFILGRLIIDNALIASECLQANGMVTTAARSLWCLSWILPKLTIV
jgi:hypothetical protein